MTPREAMHDQARSCGALGSPLTARVCRLLADRITDQTEVGARLLAWPGEPSSRGDSIALRMAGGFHALVLTGAEPALAEAWAQAADLSDDHLWSVMDAALTRHAAHFLHWLASAPQTNEVRRSAVLIAVGHWLAARYKLPLMLSELGASAGLNLMWDRWGLDLPDGRLGPADAPMRLAPLWHGTPPGRCDPRVIERAGVDLNPLDPVHDRLRILSYIWADQADRLARTRAALDVAAASPVRVERGDAIDWLEARLARPHPGAVHLVYHTIAWQYFPAEARARGEAMLAAAGARARDVCPLARLGMEADDTGGHGAGITLQLWPGGKVIQMGRVDFHGRWLDWTAPPP